MRTTSVMICASISLGSLAAAAAHAQSAVTLQEALKRNPQAATISRGLTGRIVGGETVEIAHHPWQVGLVRGLIAEPTRSQFCGGSIVAASWILTAAHCVRNGTVREDPARVDVVAGTSQFVFGGDRVKVMAIHVHPQYNNTTQEFDFALLRLTRPLTTSASTRPADLADATTEVVDGTPAFVTGWGATAEGAPGSIDLLGADVPVVSNAVCNMKDSYNGDITASMLCAGKEKGGVDSCQGDSGGPLSAEIRGRKILIGVVSWGEGCARRLKYGVYSRVSVAALWIASTVGK